jgi:hypothetical protein
MIVINNNNIIYKDLNFFHSHWFLMNNFTICTTINFFTVTTIFINRLITSSSIVCCW